MFVLFLILGLSQINLEAFAQRCPEIHPKPNFDMDRYLGTWYEDRRYANPFEGEATCVEEKLQETAEGIVRVQQILRLPVTYEVITLNATLRHAGPPEDPNNGHFRIQYDGRPEDSDYIILGTDYDLFAIVWNCRSIRGRRTEYAWVLTRTKEVSSKNKRIIDDFIRRHTPIQLDVLKKTPQDCPES